MKKRCVAFLDILGFKTLVTTLPLDELVGRYERIISEARALMVPHLPNSDNPRLFPRRPNHLSWCTQYIFSDSVILVANADTDAACLELLIYVWRLEQLFLASGMPLRGAVEYGEIYSNTGSGVVLGKALSTAYKTEGEQDWIGICINGSVAKQYTDLFKKVVRKSPLTEIFKMYSVPLKDGTVKEAYTINWRFNYIVEDGTRSLFVSSHPDPGVQKKIANTLAYARAIVESGRVYVRDDVTVPLELRAFWVGKREPPFPHGDDL